MRRPAVSIITPAYNAEPFLADTIRSVLAQTMRDFEMLIVDDGSTDGTAALARHFADRDTRVHLFRQTNGGISAARNAAIAPAAAPVPALLATDVVWLPAYRARQLRRAPGRPPRAP